MSVDRLATRSGGVIGTIGPIRGSGVFSLQERYALTADNYEDVSIYLKMNGANGSTTFYDSSLYGHTVTANGDAQISTAQSKFGGASAAFDGTGDWLSLASSGLFSFGTGDFTIEAWIYGNNISVSIIDTRSADVLGSYIFGISSSKLDFLYSTASPYRLTSTNNVPSSQWSHVAVTRSSGTLRLFIDGSQEASTTATGVIDANNTPAIGGGRSTGASTVNGYFFNGYIDDFRVTKGVARYTANFTPPQREFLP